jgi:hypothetical protein
MRDSGLMGNMMDFFTVFFGAALFATKPLAAAAFVRAPTHTHIRYGNAMCRAVTAEAVMHCTDSSLACVQGATRGVIRWMCSMRIE